MTAGNIALVIGGVGLVTIAAFDLFLTVFNYDGFTFVASRYQRLCWRVVLIASQPLPGNARHATRSLGSAMLVPATIVLWLATEICGFALIYAAGLAMNGFQVAHQVSHGLGAAFYLAAGAISTLTFGDILPRAAPFQAAVVVEAITGLATFTLALGYAVTTFGVLGELDALHSSVRRHARDPGRPSSILARHYRGGEATELSDLLQVLSEQLEAYDEGLRRYPVVFYFHSRRRSRSIPEVFTNLGGLLADIRWGLPAADPMNDDPWAVALLEQYAATLARLHRSFVGPPDLQPGAPVDADQFARAYSTGEGDAGAVAFRMLQDRTRSAAGLPGPPDDDVDVEYQRYREWLQFHQTNAVILEHVAIGLGYEPGAPAVVL